MTTATEDDSTPERATPVTKQDVLTCRTSAILDHRGTH
jgi:hypothetical protein